VSETSATLQHTPPHTFRRRRLFPSRSAHGMGPGDRVGAGRQALRQREPRFEGMLTMSYICPYDCICVCLRQSCQLFSYVYMPGSWTCVFFNFWYFFDISSVWIFLHDVLSLQPLLRLSSYVCMRLVLTSPQDNSRLTTKSLPPITHTHIIPVPLPA